MFDFNTYSPIHPLPIVASPAQATAAERVLPHPYAQTSPVSSSHHTPDSLARQNLRARNPPPASSEIVNQHFEHVKKPQELVQTISEKLPNRTHTAVSAEPVIVLDDIGDQLNSNVKSNVSRLPLPPTVHGDSAKMVHSSSGKSKTSDTKKKNEPVVRLKMLDEAVCICLVFKYCHVLFIFVLWTWD